MLTTQIKVLKQTELLGQQFQVYGTPQEPLFIAIQVAEMIEHSQPSKLVQMVDDDEKLMGTLFLSGQNREVWMLTEYGLYEVLMQTRKPIAKQFKKCVKDLLKSIRMGLVMRFEPKDFHGVPMVITADKRGYYFRDVLSAVGYSRTSGTANDYKKRYPRDFFQLAGRNYCSPRIAELIGKRAEIRQLEAEMMQSLPSGEEVCL